MKKRYKSALLSCILILCAVILQTSGFLKNLENQMQDSRYQQGGLIRPDILVIGIDEETLMEYGPWQDWSREKTAELITYLNEDPMLAPAVIGLDIGFFGSGKDGETDQKLAEAAGLLDNVVTTSYATFGKEITVSDSGDFSASEVVQTYEIPFEEFREQVSWGFSNMPMDEDGIVRHALYQMPVNGEWEYSFASELYHKYMGEYPACVQEHKETGYIPFSGFPYDYYGSETAGISLARVLDGTFPKEMFTGCIVLFGPYSVGMMDAYYTAISHDVPMFGVEIHANILQAMLDETVRTEMTGVLAAMILGIVGILVSAGWITGKSWLAGGVYLLVCAGYWFLTGTAYEAGYVLPIFYPLACASLVFIGQVGWHYVKERRAKKQIQSLFGRYVSDSVVSTLVKGGEDAVKLGGSKKDIAVLFVDVRGFTPLSEGLDPERVVEILNRYFEATTKAVFDQGGTVDKFIGDATMAIFNAPLDLDDYVFRAVKSGLAMAKASREMEAELERQTGRKVGLGVGINCGEAVIGNIGTAKRMEYTAIGSTVNMASRLEGKAKGGEVVISPNVYERIKDRILVTSMGPVALKGIQEPVELYRVDGVIE